MAKRNNSLNRFKMIQDRSRGDSDEQLIYELLGQYGLWSSGGATRPSAPPPGSHRDSSPGLQESLWGGLVLIWLYNSMNIFDNMNTFSKHKEQLEMKWK